MPHGPLSPGMAATPRFKSQRQSSSVAPFWTPPTISYTCQHSHILPGLLGCHSKSGQVWPHAMGPIFSKLSHRCCNQGELPPSYILGGSHSHPPGSKHGHSYLTYLWNQLKAIDMLNDYSRVSCTAVATQNSSEWPCSMLPFPQLRLVGWGHPIYIFHYFLDTLSSGPHYKTLFGPLPLGCTLLYSHFPIIYITYSGLPVCF